MTSTIAAWAAYCMLVGWRDLPPDTVAASIWYQGRVVADAMTGGYCPFGRMQPKCKAVYIEAIPGSTAYWQLEVKTKAGAAYYSTREVALPNKPMMPQRHVKKVCDLWNQRHVPR